jgi:hypothetical protein
MPMLAFLPNPKYAGRRVEEFVTEADAKEFLIGTEQTKAFRIATDLFDAGEKDKVQELIDKALEPVLARLAALETRLQASSGVRSPHPTIGDNKPPKR